MYRSLLLPRHDSTRNSSESLESSNSGICNSSGSIMMPPRRPQPRQVPEKTVQGYSPRFSKFLSDATLPMRPFVHDHIVTPAETTANSLRETRQRINMKVIEEDDEERECIALERRYVTDVYDQAIAKLGELPDNHVQIAAECTRKVRVILGIITANPSDPVFTTAGQLLKPLEPQYANPRIESREDTDSHRAQWRLEQWRKEGWPHQYPVDAIRREREEKGERLVGRGRLRKEALRRKSQLEDGITDFSPEEDRKRARRRADKEKNGEKKVERTSAREEIGPEDCDMELDDDDDWY